MKIQTKIAKLQMHENCFIKFIKLGAKKEIKCLASLTIYLFSSTRLINSIKHEHSCKILYVAQQHHQL